MKSKNLFGKKPEWRTTNDVVDERDSKRGIIHNYQTGAPVEVLWGWNDAVEKDKMFKLRFKHKGESVCLILDSEELMRWARYV